MNSGRICGRRAGIVALLILTTVVSGCRACWGREDKWTIDSAILKIGSRRNVAECTAEQFTLLTYQYTPSRGLETTAREIKFKDIAKVQLEPEVVWIIVSPIIAGIIGPLVYDLVIYLVDGTKIVVVRECYAGLCFLPCWLYPYVVIHGYSLGDAIDYMRLHSVQSDPGTNPGGMGPEGGR